MSECPFDINIMPSKAPADAEHLRCIALIRKIEGVREVYDALWNGQPVIVKIFLSFLQARRHVQREWRGLQQLNKRNLSAPKPLYFGRTEKGGWALVTEKITDSALVYDLFFSRPQSTWPNKLMSMVVREVARQHQKGVAQQDPHLGNYMIKEEQIYALDPAQMRFLSKPLCRSKSLRLMAKLLLLTPQANMDIAWSFMFEYANIRSWTLSPADKERFGKYFYKIKAQGVKNFLKKCLRTSKHFLRHRSEPGCGMIRRDLCSKNQFDDFARNIDKLMDSGQIFKNGNTCYVSRVQWNDKYLVVKRYNHKGIFHSVRHTFKKSRARRNWANGYRLGQLDIPTALPVAFYEQKKYGFVWQSYIINEYIKGPKLNEFLADIHISKKDKHGIIDQAIELLDKLEKQRITHGDLKHSNIIISTTGVALIDLDSLMYHHVKWYFQYKKAKDRKRFKTFDI